MAFRVRQGVVQTSSRDRAEIHEPFKKALGIEEHHKVMIYYGSVTYSRLPLFKLLIETVKILSREHQGIKLLIVGKGDAVREVKRLIHANGLDENVLLIPPFPTT